MPLYVNPSNHPVTLAMSQPRVSMLVFPYAWVKSRLPEGAKLEVELDEKLATPFVNLNMLKLKELADRPSSRMQAQIPFDPTGTAAANPVPMEPADEKSAPVAAQIDATSTEPLPNAAAATPKTPIDQLTAAVDRGEITPEDAALKAASIAPPPVNRPPSPPRKPRYNL